MKELITLACSEVWPVPGAVISAIYSFSLNEAAGRLKAGVTSLAWRGRLCHRARERRIEEKTKVGVVQSPHTSTS